MKKMIIFVLVLCLLLCACTPAFELSNGSVLDENFVQTFPFKTYSLSEMVDWFNEENNYKIENTDELNHTVCATYQGNVEWYITAGFGVDGIPNIDGCYVLFVSSDDYSENDYSIIFDSIMDELTELCGSPTTVYDSGAVVFYYSDLRIILRPSQTAVTLEMFYEA